MSPTARELSSGSSSFAVPGKLAVLACPPALCPHLEFTVSGVLSSPVSLTWTAQPGMPGFLFAGLEWRASPATAGRVASALRRLGHVTFETVEGPSPGCDAERYSYTPELGLHRAAIAANGDVVVGEAALRALLERGEARETLSRGLHRLLGTAWDDVLEPLRRGAGRAVRLPRESCRTSAGRAGGVDEAPGLRKISAATSSVKARGFSGASEGRGCGEAHIGVARV